MHHAERVGDNKLAHFHLEPNTILSIVLVRLRCLVYAQFAEAWRAISSPKFTCLVMGIWFRFPLPWV